MEKVDEWIKVKHCQLMSYISKNQHGQKQGEAHLWMPELHNIY